LIEPQIPVVLAPNSMYMLADKIDKIAEAFPEINDLLVRVRLTAKGCRFAPTALAAERFQFAG
jgi:hypothetical protein